MNDVTTPGYDPSLCCFTVVVTVFERPALVPQVLFGVSRQDWAGWDLIFVADGPQPEAALIIDDFRCSAPSLASKIQFVTCPAAPGHWGNAARRAGLEQATGDYTVFLGHDCIVFPGYLAAHVKNIMRVPGCLSLVDIDCWVTREYGSPEIMLPHPKYSGIRPSRRKAIEALEINEVDLTCMAFPTLQARELGVFGVGKEIYCADYDSAYLVCRKVLPVVHKPGIVGAHF